tara:strand:- start:4572 stop:5666 length:1095 start_codon:yes stop_codon:yes gene_type:complete
MIQKEFFGYGSINNLKEIFEIASAREIFLVTGNKSFEVCGARDACQKFLPEYTQFCNFAPNPKLEQIKKGLEEFRKKDYDMIVSIGGGSVIDVAKAIKMFHYGESRRNVPLVAIPTTAGSGSEATYFIAYYDGKEKHSSGKSGLTLPNYVICDPGLTFSLPRKLAASTSIDALGQAIESYWNVNSTPKSQEFSREAIRLLMGNLENAVNYNNRISKGEVMKAANLAGKAINLTKTTASHAISYPITSFYSVPHGHAVGLTLGEILKFNFQVDKESCNDNRGVEYVKKNIQELCKMLGSKTIYEAKEKITNLMKTIGLETKLSGLGINEFGIETIIKNGFAPERVKNNPRILTERDLRKILKEVY